MAFSFMLLRYFVNDTVIVRAIRTILPGEVVHENYGQVSSTTRKEERQAVLLDHYWFQCDCIACRDDWPTFDELTNEAMSFRCEHCRTFICKADDKMGILFRCGKCGKSVNILKSLKSLHDSEKAYKKALEFLDSGDEETGLGILLQNIALLDTYLMPPFRDFHLCQEHVRKCLLNLGNKISQQPSWDPEEV
jgi:DNA-directed RNA polymerase subunit RPC12/RpoP